MRARSLRDEFAMAALTGLLAYSVVNPQRGSQIENYATYLQDRTARIKNTVRDAYAYADEAMKIREEVGDE